MTLQRKILLEKVSSYRSLLYGLSDRYGTGSYRKSENEYYFYMYTPQGVIISLRAARNCGFIKLTINLNSLLYMEIQRVALFSPCRDYMRTLDCNLRDILRDAQLGAPETFMFARVDFSVNAQTPDPLAYIALAHRGGVPNGFKQTYPRFDNKKRNKPIHYAYSYDLKHSTEDYAVSLYSKADQLRDDYNAQFTDYQDAQGMLRFEAKYGAAMLQKHFGITDLSYSPVPAGIIVYPVQSYAGLLSGGNILLACGGAGAACPSGKIRAEGAAGHMDCADLTHGQRLQGTPCALRGTFRLAV